MKKDTLLGAVTVLLAGGEEMALSSIECAWLEYAREVVCNEEHRRRCQEYGGSAPNRCGVDATDVRWPGYLGRNYQPGGVLCVAMIHREFESDGVEKADIIPFVEATRDWKHKRSHDEKYLEAVRKFYTIGLTKWNVKSNIEPVLKHLEIDVESICYVNAARCQYPETKPKLPNATETKKALVQLCLLEFPIKDLVTRIKAAVVLFTNVAAYQQTKHWLKKNTDAVAVVVHPWKESGKARLIRDLSINGLTFPKDTSVECWSPSVREHLQRHILTGG